MPRMADEAARAELDRIAADLGISINHDEADVVLRALQYGRLEWDAAEQTFLVQLQNPIQLDNGQKIGELTLAEPTAAQMKKSQAVADTFEQSLRLVGYCTDQPVGYIERLKVRDLNLLGALVGFFR